VNFESTETGIHGWFFVQKSDQSPWELDPTKFIVVITSPERDRVYEPVVQSLPKRGMYGFNVGPKFLRTAGKYTTVIASRHEGIALPPLQGTFDVVHENR
jgi:hypothetical protein